MAPRPKPRKLPKGNPRSEQMTFVTCPPPKATPQRRMVTETKTKAQLSSNICPIGDESIVSYNGFNVTSQF